MNRLILLMVLTVMVFTAAKATEISLPEKVKFPSKGSEADVIIQIKDLKENCRGFEIELEFDSTVASVKEVSLKDFLTSTGLSADLLGPVVSGNTVKFGAILKGSGTFPTGSGDLAVVRFTGLKSGETPITVKSLSFVDDNVPVNDITVSVAQAGTVEGVGVSSDGGGGGGCSFNRESSDLVILVLLLSAIILTVSLRRFRIS
ncbi:cohesin domain-containing protein [Persephonella sp.]